MIDKIEKAEVAFGFVSDDISCVIITSISRVFQEVGDYFKNAHFYSAFHDSYVIKRDNGEKIMVIDIIPGVHGWGICGFFNNIDIYFVGYACGISEKTVLGGVYEVENAFLKSGECICLEIRNKFDLIQEGNTRILSGWIVDDNYKNVYTTWGKNIRHYSTEELEVIERECYVKAKKYNCDAVDMDISDCAKNSLEHNNRFTAWVIIKELQCKRNIFELSDEDKKKVLSGEDRIISQIIEDIEIRNG